MHSPSASLSCSPFNIDIVTKVGAVEKFSHSTPFVKANCDPFLCRRQCFWNNVVIPEADKYFLMFRYKHWFQHPAQKDDRHRLIAEVQEFRDGAIVSTKRFIIPNIEQNDMNEREVKLTDENANWNECDFVQVKILYRRLFGEILLTRFRMQSVPVKEYDQDLQKLMQDPSFKSLIDERRREEFERRLGKGLFTRYWPVTTVNIDEPVVVDQDGDESQPADGAEELAAQMVESLFLGED